MNAPLISVCIANYDGMAIIDECIRSVERQTGNPAVEIIVHDDASSDGSAAHIQANYPNVKLMQSTENVGFCIANNRMAEAARGEYLLLLNNDAALFPDALATLVQTAREIAQPAILGLPQYDFVTGILIDRGCLLDPFLNPVPNLDPQRREVGMVIGACLWIPKSLWTELGGFPEWFGSIGEDMYLCSRARLAGHKVIAVGHSGYRHHAGSSFGGGKVISLRLSTTFRRRALSERNKSYVMVAAYPTPAFQIIFPLHLFLLALEGAVLTIRKRDRRYWREIYIRSFTALWSERTSLQRLRLEMQATRQVTWTQFFEPFTWLPHKLRMLLRHGLPEVA